MKYSRPSAGCGSRNSRADSSDSIRSAVRPCSVARCATTRKTLPDVWGSARVRPMADLRPEGPLEGRIVRVETIVEQHRDGLREAAEREPQIHRFTNMYTLGFERWFDLALESDAEIPFVVHVDGRPVGSTRYLNVEPAHRRTEIGWTWLERPQWGTGANIETKYLLLRNA